MRLLININLESSLFYILLYESQQYVTMETQGQQLLYVFCSAGKVFGIVNFVQIRFLDWQIRNDCIAIVVAVMCKNQTQNCFDEVLEDVCWATILTSLDG
eukprot:TRINITY_DN989_c1_g1_i3.p11 TRINITY_DN989_c1_g1~~TRINITY_DN989_c1_g1_i3.p11  ORF type:complete len:100 (+),score=7.30 TRINITY_DN989_c1_g1_i3:1594-1893(+)